MDTSTIITTSLLAVIKMFLIVFVGIIAAKVKIITKDNMLVLTKMTLYVFTPALVVNSFIQEFDDEKLRGILVSAALCAAYYIIGAIIASILISKSRSSYRTKRACVIYLNCGYVGIPLAQSIFGAEAVLYMSVHLALAPLFMWTYCPMLLSGKFDKRSLVKNIVSPPMLASIIGLVIFIFRIPIPEVIHTPLASVGGCASPLSLIIAGAIIAQSDIKAALKQFDTYLVCLLRLIVIPAIMIPITLLFRQSCPQLALSVSMLAAVTPVASAVQMAAQLYEGDDRCAALMFAISTLMCIITIPLMLTLYFQF